MSTLDISNWQQRLRDFAAARDWERFHSAKNLSMALSVEAGEIVELFQWLDDDTLAEALASHDFLEALGDEIADVLIYLMRLADISGVDIPTALDSKMIKNAAKHPPPNGAR